MHLYGRMKYSLNMPSCAGFGAPPRCNETRLNHHHPTSPSSAIPPTSHMQSLISSTPVAPPSSAAHLLRPTVSATPSNTFITSSKRKRSASESSGPISAPSSTEASSGSKQLHTDEVAALARIADELRIFNNTYRMTCQMAPVDNDAIGQAQDMLEKDEPDIGDEAIIAIMDLFKSDVASARMYVRFKRTSLRKRWVRRELQKMNFLLPDEPAS